MAGERRRVKIVSYSLRMQMSDARLMSNNPNSPVSRRRYPPSASRWWVRRIATSSSRESARGSWPSMASGNPFDIFRREWAVRHRFLSPSVARVSGRGWPSTS